MRTITSGIAKLVFAFIFIAVSTILSNRVQAQETERGFILSMTEFTIKPGHNNQFREGVKAWKACYLENEGEWTWNMWSRVNGEGNVYVLTSTMSNWAEMDETDESGMKCRDVARDLINPHVESAENNYLRFLPEHSKTYPNPDQVLWVTYWQTKNRLKFLEIVKEVTAETTKVEGAPRSFWYSVMGGGKDAADFLAATPFANFAAMDVERENVWTNYEKIFGKEKRDEMQSTFREITDVSWSYIYRLAVDLSHIPPTE